MVDDPVQDGRNPMAHGYVLASRVMSMGLQMVVPLGVGWWIDSVIHTRPWCMVLGAIMGFLVVMSELVQLAKDSARSGRRVDSSDRSSGQDKSD